MKIKVKVISSTDKDFFEEQVNEFINTHEIESVDFASNSHYYYNAFITYSE